MEKNLTAGQCEIIGRRIIDTFHRLCAGGTQYGCDWPTMRVLFPAKCRVFERLRTRWQSLQTA